MQISMRTDIKEATKGLDDVQRRQIPFATALALNRTGEEANAALRKHIIEKFTIRVPRLLDLATPRQLKGPKRATKTRLRVVLDAETGAAKLFRAYEKGDIKTGGINPLVAIPTFWLRPHKSRVIPPRLFPTNLGFQSKRNASGKLYTAKGKAAKAGRQQGIFAILPTTHPNASPKQWGVYQRTGPGQVIKLWHFRGAVKRPAILEWEKTVGHVASTRFAPNFVGALSRALATARPGGGATPTGSGEVLG